MLETISARKKTEFPVRFVLQSGDAVVDGRDSKQWNASFLSIINRLTTKGGVPYFLAPGNHDVTSASELNSTNRLKGLSNYLAAVSELIPAEGASRRLEDYPTFAFGYGNSFFIALDSNIAGDKPQYDWTVQQLESLDRNRYTNIFAFFHHPIFSSGPHGGASVEKPTELLRKMYTPLFRKYHFRAAFSGHEHLFEHWAEHYVDSAGATNRIDYVVTGGGGAPVAVLKGNPSTSEYEKSCEKEKVKLSQLARPGPEPGENPYHYVVVTVNGPSVALQVIGVDWGKDFRPYRSNKREFSD
jgi:3',5'-cyclic AMP phosphodiesterase CpdA